jgi:hypothetical protein
MSKATKIVLLAAVLSGIFVFCAGAYLLFVFVAAMGFPETNIITNDSDEVATVQVAIKDRTGSPAVLCASDACPYVLQPDESFTQHGNEDRQLEYFIVTSEDGQSTTRCIDPSIDNYQETEEERVVNFLLLKGHVRQSDVSQHPVAELTAEGLPDCRKTRANLRKSS